MVSAQEVAETRMRGFSLRAHDELPVAIPSCDPAMEVVDVCAAMNDADRQIYPKSDPKERKT